MGQSLTREDKNEIQDWNDTLCLVLHTILLNNIETYKNKNDNL